MGGGGGCSSTVQPGQKIPILAKKKKAFLGPFFFFAEKWHFWVLGTLKHLFFCCNVAQHTFCFESGNFNRGGGDQLSSQATIRLFWGQKTVLLLVLAALKQLFFCFNIMQHIFFGVWHPQHMGGGVLPLSSQAKKKPCFGKKKKKAFSCQYPAFSGAQNWAEWLHNPCLLGGPPKRGQNEPCRAGEKLPLGAVLNGGPTTLLRST